MKSRPIYIFEKEDKEAYKALKKFNEVFNSDNKEMKKIIKDTYKNYIKSYILMTKKGLSDHEILCKYCNNYMIAYPTEEENVVGFLIFDAINTDNRTLNIKIDEYNIPYIEI